MENGFDIGQSLENGVARIFDYIPQLLGAIVILIIGYFVAKALGKLVHKLLNHINFDRALNGTAAGKYTQRVIESPAHFAGKVVFWLIMLFVVSMAVSAMRLPLLDQIVNGIYAYIPRVISAIAIFLVASAISGGTAAFVQRVMGNTATAKLLSSVVPVVVMSIAAFMILNQLNIAKDIVNILFTAIVGSIALGMALAFGLGGRDVARDLLQQAYDNGKANARTAKRDVKTAAANTKAEATRVKNEL